MPFNFSLSSRRLHDRNMIASLLGAFPNSWALFFLQCLSLEFSFSTYSWTFKSILNDDFQIRIRLSANKVSRVSTFSPYLEDYFLTWFWWYSLPSVSNIISHLVPKVRPNSVRFFTNTYDRIMITKTLIMALDNRCVEFIELSAERKSHHCSYQRNHFTPAAESYHQAEKLSLHHVNQM